MSRSQLLIFTFVIAMSLFWIIMKELKFPEIQPGVWTLLGISGGSYVISKGIQCKSEEEERRIVAGQGGQPNNQPNAVQPNPVQPNQPRPG